MTDALAVEDLAVEIGGRQILRSISLGIPEARRVALCGPNGSGKSTLLRTLFGALPLSAGAVLIDGDRLGDLTRQQIARRVGVVLQERPIDFDFTVREVIEMGRTAHRGGLLGTDPNRSTAVEVAADRVGMAAMIDRRFNSLSGGEKQRALLARCLAQETPVVLLDEPTNHLDVHYQLELLSLVASLEATVVMALHDLNLAATFCDEICLIQDGAIVAAGGLDEAITEEIISQVFGVRARRATHPDTGRPHFFFSALSSAERSSHHESETEPA